MFKVLLILFCVQLWAPLWAATIAVGSSISTSVVGTNVDGPNNGASTISFSQTTVDGANTDWTLSNTTALGVQTLEATATTGSIGVDRGRGSGRDVIGSEFRSEIDFELGVDESGAYSFSFDYTLTKSAAGASDPSASWTILDSGGNVIAGSSDTTASGSLETLSGSGTLGAGSYTLVVVGELSGIPDRNTSASAALDSVRLTVEVTLVPEPSTMFFISFVALMALRRRRS